MTKKNFKGGLAGAGRQQEVLCARGDPHWHPWQAGTVREPGQGRMWWHRFMVRVRRKGFTGKGRLG